MLSESRQLVARRPCVEVLDDVMVRVLREKRSRNELPWFLTPSARCV